MDYNYNHDYSKSCFINMESFKKLISIGEKLISNADNHKIVISINFKNGITKKNLNVAEAEDFLSDNSIDEISSITIESETCYDIYFHFKLDSSSYGSGFQVRTGNTNEDKLNSTIKDINNTFNSMMKSKFFYGILSSSLTAYISFMLPFITFRYINFEVAFISKLIMVLIFISFVIYPIFKIFLFPKYRILFGQNIKKENTRISIRRFLWGYFILPVFNALFKIYSK